MLRSTLALPALAAMAACLSGCMAVSAVGTAVDVAGTAISTTADVVGAGVGAVIPDDDDCVNGRDEDGEPC